MSGMTAMNSTLLGNWKEEGNSPLDLISGNVVDLFPTFAIKEVSSSSKKSLSSNVGFLFDGRRMTGSE